LHLFDTAASLPKDLDLIIVMALLASAAGVLQQSVDRLISASRGGPNG
jgi:hypothetical protein